MQTTIVIPCYNEAKRLNGEAFKDYADKNPDVSFLFVNDGSKDNTIDVLKVLCEGKSRLQYMDLERNGGKAEAVRLGMLHAAENTDSEYIGFWDADLATPLFEIGNFLREMQRGNYSIVTGLRLKRLGNGVCRKALRHYLGRCFATAAAVGLQLPVYDTQCGAKLYKASIVPTLFATPFITRWLFDVELLARYKKIYSIEKALTDIYEYPLLEWKEVTGSQIKMRDFIKGPYELLKIINHYR